MHILKCNFMRNLQNRGLMTGCLDAIDIMAKIGLSQAKSSFQEWLRGHSPVRTCQASGTKSS